MSRTTKIINVDKDAWERIRKALPRLSDSQRSRVVVDSFDPDSFLKKLEPERHDSYGDKKLKRIMKGFL
jgi:hypothetical protein